MRLSSTRVLIGSTANASVARSIRGRAICATASASACSPDGEPTGTPISGFHRYLQRAKAANAQRLSVQAPPVTLQRHRELRAKLREMSAEEHGVLNSHVASLLASMPPPASDATDA
eukprot:jgi/Tetstr1/423133/TSEL_013902.t1